MHKSKQHHKKIVLDNDRQLMLDYQLLISKNNKNYE